MDTLRFLGRLIRIIYAHVDPPDGYAVYITALLEYGSKVFYRKPYFLVKYDLSISDLIRYAVAL